MARKYYKNKKKENFLKKARKNTNIILKKEKTKGEKSSPKRYQSFP